MSRVKFAVVREDPEIEAELVRRTSAKAVLIVASGGCTALTLCKRFPELDVTAFDVNPHQLALVKKKIDALEKDDAAELERLNQSGDFEGLFRSMRLFLDEFDANPFKTWPAGKYWPVAFELFFSDALLHAMFGREATQHAEPGSYPRYFRQVFERGLERKDAKENPFLQHVFEGRYREPPAYWGLKQPKLRLAIPRSAEHPAPDLQNYQLVSLSNIFDWSGDALAESWGKLLRKFAPKGAAVVIRQLNNRRDLRRFFEPEIAFDDKLGAELHGRDRSLFYERILVGFKK